MSENWAGEKNLQFRTGNKIKMKYEINVSDLEYIKKVVIVSANESTKAQFEYELRNPQFQIQIGCIEQSNGCEVSKDSKKKPFAIAIYCHSTTKNSICRNISHSIRSERLGKNM